VLVLVDIPDEIAARVVVLHEDPQYYNILVDLVANGIALNQDARHAARSALFAYCMWADHDWDGINEYLAGNPPYEFLRLVGGGYWDHGNFMED
jgi:hypothetical protein